MAITRGKGGLREVGEDKEGINDWGGEHTIQYIDNVL